MRPPDPEEAQQRPLPSNELGWLGIICYRAGLGDEDLCLCRNPDLTKNYQRRHDPACVRAADKMLCRRNHRPPTIVSKPCQILSNPIKSYHRERHSSGRTRCLHGIHCCFEVRKSTLRYVITIALVESLPVRETGGRATI